ncbi:MAG: DUF2341 domain-containing protein [Candidatus Nanopusillus sp.]
MIFGSIFFLIFALHGVYSLSEWLYHRPIFIYNTFSNDLTDYPILILLNTQTLILQGKMRPDCGDIRITDSDKTTLLNYWIEPHTCNRPITKIWVKIPFIPRYHNKTIYLWYGNPNATSMSNGYLVFTFFEDFQNGTIGWTPVLLFGAGDGSSTSAVWVISPYGYAGGISLTDSGGIYAAAALVKNISISISDNFVSYCFDAYIMWNITPGRRLDYDNFAIIISATNGTDEKTVAYRYVVGGSPCGGYWTAFSGTCGNDDFFEGTNRCLEPNTWITIRKYLAYDFLYLCNFNVRNITQISINVGTYYATINGYIANIIIRKCGPEPYVTLGQEYAKVTISSVQLNPSSSSAVCPGTQTSSTVTVNLNNPNNQSTTVNFSCSAPSGITCSISPYSCTTSGSSCSTTLYVNSSPITPSGSYPVTVTASILESSASATATYTYNICPNIPISNQSGITVPIIGINALNITNQNVYVTISVNGSNQNIQSINVYYNNNNVYSNNNVNTNYYSFNLQLPYSNNGNITVCSTLTNGQSGCVTQIFSLNVVQTYIYYGIIQLQAKVQPININTTYGPIGNRLEFSIDQPEYILTLNITNVGNMTLNNIIINLQQFGNVLEILYNQIPIELLNNINIDQLQPNQSYILQFSVLPLYMGSSSLLLNFNINGQNIGNAQYNLIVKGPSNKSSLVVLESINYILMLLGIIGLIIFLI